MSDLSSRPFRPDPAFCCERCVFGSGEHAAFCPEASPVVMETQQFLEDMVRREFGEDPK